MTAEQLDVLVIGAGISGLYQNCVRDLAMLERARIADGALELSA